MCSRSIINSVYEPVQVENPEFVNSVFLSYGRLKEAIGFNGRSIATEKKNCGEKAERKNLSAARPRLLLEAYITSE